MKVSFIDLFRARVRVVPHKTAIIYRDSSLTFSELDELSQRIAENLLEKRIQPGQKAIIDAHISEMLIPTMLACMKLGICFIPLPEGAPQSYIRSVASLSGTEWHIALTACPGLRYCDMGKLPATRTTSCSLPLLGEELPAFAILTSGSTGIPKLAFRTHASLLFLDKQLHMCALPFFQQKNTLVRSSLNFAFGLDQSLLLLANGTTLYLSGAGSTKSLFVEIAKEGIQQVLLPISYIKLFSRNFELMRQIPQCLRSIITGGEPMRISADFIFFCRERGIRLFNNYGCSEIGTIAMSEMAIDLGDIQNTNRIALANPLPAYTFAIIDAEGRENLTGELHILANPADEVPDCVEWEMESVPVGTHPKGALAYKTGDMAERTGLGINITGRINNIVNSRGCRISLENVEENIHKAVPGIECCVEARTDRYDETELFCFYCNCDLTREQLHLRISGEMPAYMVPGEYIRTSSLPRLPNGKVDRNIIRQMVRETLYHPEFETATLHARLKSIMESMLLRKLPEDAAKLTFNVLGLDSLAVVDYICLVENHEKVVIEDALVSSCAIDTIEKLAEYIAELGQ